MGVSEPELVQLDGGVEEGGGQLLRTALALSLVTGRPFRLEKIATPGQPDGLRPQHLACLRGAEAISGARSTGAEVGSEELVFVPAPVKPGNYWVDVGGGGSAVLLFQTLYYPLALAGGGQLVLRGGTHVPQSPTYHYLSWIWLPTLSRLGFGGQLHLKEAAFQPSGGGEFRAEIPKILPPPGSADWRARGTLRDVEVTSFVSGLPFETAERQASGAIAALREQGIYCSAENIPLPSARSRGAAVFILARFEHTRAGFCALADPAKPPETIGREAAAQVAAFMSTGAAIDEHLADQLLLPAALLAAQKLGPASPGTVRFTTTEATAHLRTQAALLAQFLPVTIDISGDEIKVAPKAP